MLAKTLSDRLDKSLPLAHRKVEHPPKPIALKKCVHGLAAPTGCATAGKRERTRSVKFDREPRGRTVTWLDRNRPAAVKASGPTAVGVQYDPVSIQSLCPQEVGELRVVERVVADLYRLE
jgi:hypothetical protein